MRRSSLLFIIFIGVLLMATIGLSFYLRSLPIDLNYAHGTGTVSLRSDKKITAIVSEIPLGWLHVRVDSTQSTSEVFSTYGNVSLQCRDSTLFIGRGEDYDEEAGCVITVALPSADLAIVSTTAISGGIHISGIATPALTIVSASPEISINSCRIGALTIASRAAETTPGRLEIVDSPVGAILSDLDADSLDMRICRSPIGDWLFSGTAGR